MNGLASLGVLEKIAITKKKGGGGSGGSKETTVQALRLLDPSKLYTREFEPLSGFRMRVSRLISIVRFSI